MSTTEALTPAERRRFAAHMRASFLEQSRRLTMEDVASILNLGINKVRQMRETGDLSFTKVGGKWTTSRAALDRDLEEMA